MHVRRAAKPEPSSHEDASAAAAAHNAVRLPRERTFGLGRWLREPLLHFLLAGFLLFAAYHALNPGDNARLAPNRIVITDGDLRQMAASWAAQGRPPATADQWAALIETKVREEILFREALALGLDKDDTIVKRRMAQKMESMLQELAKVADPEPAELKAWFDSNLERFAHPPRASFMLLHFSSERRGKRARADAESAMAKLASAARDAPIADQLADSSIPSDSHVDRTPAQVAREMGREFAQALFALKPSAAWQGPIESAHGWHLVRLNSLEAPRTPSFGEAEAEAKAAWLDERNAEARRKIYAAMRARYDVVIPEPPKTPGAAVK